MTRAYNTATTQQNTGGAVTGVTAGKNAIINGGMDIWQRGTTFTNGGQYTADRWYFDISASTVTSTRESTIVPAGFQYSWKVNKSAGSSTATLMGQTVETANAIQFAGKTVTLSFYAAADAATTFTPVLTYSTSADNARGGSWTNITPTVNGSTSVSTTTFVRIISTFAVPSTAKSLFMYIEPSIAASASIYVTGFQLEVGSVATPFSRAGGTITGELAACQRYYYRTSNPALANAQLGGIGFSYSTTNGVNAIPLPVQMRIVPTSLDYSGLRPYDITAGSVLTFTSATFSGDSTPTVGCYTYAFSAATANRMIRVDASSTTSYIGFGAEL